MKVVRKIVLILLIIGITCNSLPIYALEKIVNSNTGWDYALHFIIRHWHVSQTVKNEEYEESESGQNFVIIEGYIVPQAIGYEIYIVNQENGNKEKLTSSSEYDKNYINSFDTTTGTITLTANPLYVDDTPLEEFSSFSVTSGHKAVNVQNQNKKIVIKFEPYVHLVKVHAFYVNESMTVIGSGQDDRVFGTNAITDSLEQDVAWVYTYIEKTSKHEAGEIVRDDEGKPINKEEDLNKLSEKLIVGEDVN